MKSKTAMDFLNEALSTPNRAINRITNQPIIGSVPKGALGAPTTHGLRLPFLVGDAVGQARGFGPKIGRDDFKPSKMVVQIKDPRTGITSYKTIYADVRNIPKDIEGQRDYFRNRVRTTTTDQNRKNYDIVSVEIVELAV